MAVKKILAKLVNIDSGAVEIGGRYVSSADWQELEIPNWCEPALKRTIKRGKILVKELKEKKEVVAPVPTPPIKEEVIESEKTKSETPKSKKGSKDVAKATPNKSVKKTAKKKVAKSKPKK